MTPLRAGHYGCLPPFTSSRIASKLLLPGAGSLPHNSGYRRSEGMSVRQQSKHELVVAQRERYRRASRREKGQILDEFVAATGYHRKHALRLFRQGPPAPRAGHGGRPRQYDAGVIGALRAVAE